MRPPLFLAVAVVFCARSAHCQEIKCVEPASLYIHYRVQQGGDFQEEFPIGTTVTYRCGPGYISRKIKTWNATCKEKDDGSVYWDIDQYDCRPVSCGHPGDIRFGRLMDAVFVFPKQVRYQCNKGYRLEGQGILYCQSDAQWNAPKPECHIVECDTLEGIANGTVRLSGTVYGSKAEFSCNQGFELKGNSARTCEADGQWSDESPHCEEIWCSEQMLQEFSQRNGSVLVDNEPISGRQRSNTRVRYICPANTDLVGSDINICQENGGWLFEPPACKPKCIARDGPGSQVLRKLRYGWSYEWSVVEPGTQVSEFDSSLFVRCVDGYHFAEQYLRHTGKPATTLSCKEGVWDPPEPWCTEKPCATTGRLPQGVEAEQNWAVSHGQQMKFRCKKGYTMQNADYRHPLCDRGKLVGKLPTCNPDDCRIENLPHVNNGSHQAHQNVSHNSLATYECNHPLELQERGEVRCRFGEWLGTPPLCVQKKCVVPVAPGTLVQRHSYWLKVISRRVEVEPRTEVTEKDQNLFVSCTQGYHLTTRQSETKLLCINGVWEPPGPWCAEENQSNKERKGCKFGKRQDRFKAHHKGKFVKPEGTFQHGTKLVFHCEPVGEVIFRGPRTAECIDGQWTPPDEPYCYSLEPRGIAVHFQNDIYTAPGGTVYVEPNSEVVVSCRSNIPVDLYLVLEEQWHAPRFNQRRLVEMRFRLHLNTSARITCQNADVKREIIVRGQPLYWCAPFSSTSEGLQIIPRNQRTYHFKCKNGYEIVGAKYLHCLEHGEWSDPTPKCKPISGASSIHTTEQSVDQPPNPAGASSAAISTLAIPGATPSPAVWTAGSGALHHEYSSQRERRPRPVQEGYDRRHTAHRSFGAAQEEPHTIMPLPERSHSTASHNSNCTAPAHGYFWRNEVEETAPGGWVWIEVKQGEMFISNAVIYLLCTNGKTTPKRVKCVDGRWSPEPACERNSQSTAEPPETTTKAAAGASAADIGNENAAPKTEEEHRSIGTESPVLYKGYSTQGPIDAHSGASKDLNDGSNSDSTVKPNSVPGQGVETPPQDRTSHSEPVYSQTCATDTPPGSCSERGNRNVPSLEGGGVLDAAGSITANNTNTAEKRDDESTRDASGSRTSGPGEDTNSTAPPPRANAKPPNHREHSKPQPPAHLSTTSPVLPTIRSSAEATTDLPSGGNNCSVAHFFEIAPVGLVIVVNETHVAENSTFKVSCDDGLTLVGDGSAVTCLQNGSWNLPSNTTCIEACGDFDTGPGGPTVEGRKAVYDLGDSITLSCKNGTELQPRIERITCLGDRWSESAVPICVPAEKDKTKGAKNKGGKSA